MNANRTMTNQEIFTNLSTMEHQIYNLKIVTLDIADERHQSYLTFKNKEFEKIWRDVVSRAFIDIPSHMIYYASISQHQLLEKIKDYKSSHIWYSKDIRDTYSKYFTSVFMFNIAIPNTSKLYYSKQWMEIFEYMFPEHKRNRSTATLACITEDDITSIQRDFCKRYSCIIEKIITHPANAKLTRIIIGYDGEIWHQDEYKITTSINTIIKSETHLDRSKMHKAYNMKSLRDVIQENYCPELLVKLDLIPKEK